MRVVRRLTRSKSKKEDLLTSTAKDGNNLALTRVPTRIDAILTKVSNIKNFECFIFGDSTAQLTASTTYHVHDSFCNRFDQSSSKIQAQHRHFSKWTMKKDEMKWGENQPRCALKSFTNTSPSSLVFFQNLTQPSALAVIKKFDLQQMQQQLG